MTIAEVLTQRGYEKGYEVGLKIGKELGIELVAAQMFRNGIELAYIAQAMDLSPERITGLADRLDSLDR